MPLQVASNNNSADGWQAVVLVCTQIKDRYVEVLCVVDLLTNASCLHSCPLWRRFNGNVDGEMVLDGVVWPRYQVSFVDKEGVGNHLLKLCISNAL
jgi:hypothetical protein